MRAGSSREKGGFALSDGGWICEAQQPGRILVGKPQQAAVLRLDSLCWKSYRAARPEDICQNLGFACDRDKEENFCRVIQHSKREADAKTLELLHPVGDHSARDFFERRSAGKERGGVAIVSKSEHDQIEARPIIVGQMKKITQLVFVVLRCGFRIQFRAHPMDVLL